MKTVIFLFSTLILIAFSEPNTAFATKKCYCICEFDVGGSAPAHPVWVDDTHPCDSQEGTECWKDNKKGTREKCTDKKDAFLDRLYEIKDFAAE